MIKIKNAENNAINMLNIGEKLEKEISVIKANKFSDQEFIDFLVSLIAYNPNGRPNFEQIYRNKQRFRSGNLGERRSAKKERLVFPQRKNPKARARKRRA